MESKAHREEKQRTRDFFSSSERSALMARIRSRANMSTELRIASILRSEKIREWRRHLPLPGRPDFTFRKQHVCIFVHGCFWHGCPKCNKRSSTRPAYWLTKIETNRRRDRRVSQQLRERGYKVIVVWECALRRKHPEQAINRLLSLLRQSKITPLVPRDVRLRRSIVL